VPSGGYWDGGRCREQYLADGHGLRWRGQQGARWAASTGRRARGAAGPSIRPDGVMGMPAGDHAVPDDLGPAELADGEAVSRSAEDPCLLGRVEQPTCWYDSVRLFGWGKTGPFRGRFHRRASARGEGALGGPDPIVGGPTRDDRVRGRVITASRCPCRPYLRRQNGSGSAAALLKLGLVRQLAVGVAADVNPSEIENPSMRGTICVLASLKASPRGLQPPGEPALTCPACAREEHKTGQIVGLWPVRVCRSWSGSPESGG